MHKNRNEWPTDLDWMKVLNLLSHQEKDEETIGHRIEKRSDERGRVSYPYPSANKPVEGTVVARILHVWEVAGTAKQCNLSRQFVIAAGSHLLMIVKKPPYLAAKFQ